MADNIEITPEMLREGHIAVGMVYLGKDSLDQLLAEIFTRMWTATTPEYRERMMARRRREKIDNIISLFDNDQAQSVPVNA